MYIYIYIVIYIHIHLYAYSPGSRAPGWPRRPRLPGRSLAGLHGGARSLAKSSEAGVLLRGVYVHIERV